MTRIEFGTTPTQLKPFIITGLNLAFTNQGAVRVAMTFQEVVDVRWNSTAERWEWYDFEAGHWHFSGGDV